MGIINVLVATLLHALYLVLNLYLWIIIVSAIMSWLIAFNVINTRNRFVEVIGDMTYRLTEPALRHIRRYVPPIGGLDLSFLALWIIVECGLYFISMASRLVL